MTNIHELSKVPYAENTVIEAGHMLAKLRNVPFADLDNMDLALDSCKCPIAPTMALVQIAEGFYQLALALAAFQHAQAAIQRMKEKA